MRHQAGCNPHPLTSDVVVRFHGMPRFTFLLDPFTQKGTMDIDWQHVDKALDTKYLKAVGLNTNEPAVGSDGTESTTSASSPSSLPKIPRFFAMIHLAPYEVLRKCVERNPSLVHMVAACGTTPLHVAACASDVKRLTLLLKCGADPVLSDQEGVRPAHVAASMGLIPHLDLLQYSWGEDIVHACVAGADPLRTRYENTHDLKDMYWTHKVNACVRTLEFIHSRHPELLNMCDSDGNHPMSFVMDTSNAHFRSSLFWAFVRLGLRVRDCMDADGTPLIFRAVEQGHTKMALWLVDKTPREQLFYCSKTPEGLLGIAVRHCTDPLLIRRLLRVLPWLPILWGKAGETDNLTFLLEARRMWDSKVADAAIANDAVTVLEQLHHEGFPFSLHHVQAMRQNGTAMPWNQTQSHFSSEHVPPSPGDQLPKCPSADREDTNAN